MSDFSTAKTLKARVLHCCMQCNGAIAKGSSAVRSKGRWEGELYSHHLHPECHAAAQAYAEKEGAWGDEYPWFAHGDFEHEDRLWMVINHIAVARRLGWDEQVKEWLEDADEDCLTTEDRLALAVLAATPASPDEVGP